MMNNSAVPTSRMTMAPKRNAAAARSAFVTGPDINQNNANIAAMASQVDGMQARMNQPQHLRFADLGNRAMVNSGLGGQMDGGNLPSSQNQLAFANRQEQRGQRADAQMASVMNPTFHNGIKVNPAAVARNLSMSAGDKQNLTANGWEVSPGGVIQRAPRKQTGGGTFGAPNPAMSASTEAQPMNQASIAAGRARYGLPEDGSGRQLSGRAAAIMARTDISPEEKQQFIEKANALDFMKGRKTMADLDLSSQMEAIGALKERSDRIVAKKTREGYFNNIRQQQAQAQQQAMMGQVAQAAMMGNPQAMQMMETMQRGNQNAAQIAMEQARLMQDGQYKQGVLDLQKQENTLAGERNNLIASQQSQAAQAAAEAARRQDAMRQADMAHKQNMERMQADSLSKRQEAEAELNPIRKRALEAEAQAAELAARQADFEFEQSKSQAGEIQPLNKDKFISDMIAGGNVSSVDQAREAADKEEARRTFDAVSEQDPATGRLRAMPPDNLQVHQNDPVKKIDYFMDRANSVGNFYKQGSRLDGSGEMPDPAGMLAKMREEGIGPYELQQYVADYRPPQGLMPVEGGAGVTADELLERGQITPEKHVAIIKQNMVRSVLGMPEYTFRDRPRPSPAGYGGPAFFVP